MCARLRHAWEQSGGLAPLCAAQSMWHWALGWLGGGSCLEPSRACASFCRMHERATQTWNTGGWLLALCLAWLWTRLASASLQPPTPTGLGEVVGPTPGGTWFSRMPGKLDTNHPTPFHSRQISEAEYNPQILGVWHLFLTQELCPLCYPSPKRHQQTHSHLPFQAGRCSAGRGAPGSGLKSSLLA